MTERPPDPRINQELLQFLKRNPRSVRVLMTRHVDDGTGRCAACTSGAQAGRPLWPCTLARHARYVARLLAIGEPCGQSTGEPPTGR